RAQFGVVDPLHAVAEGRLDGADVADQAAQAAGLDGRGLVGAPHGAVEGDVALDEGGAEGDGGQGGLQAGLVAGVADGDVRVLLLEGVDHPQVELLGLRRVGGGGVAEQDVVRAQDLDRVADLLRGGHAGGQDDRAAGGAQCAQQLVVGEGGGGDLVGGDVELLQEGDGLGVPRGGEPGDALLPAVGVDLAVLLLAELHAVPVVDVGHPAPGGVAFDVPLVARGADLRGALLELDGVAAGFGGGVDQLERVLDVAVVVDADLAGDVDGAAGAGLAGTERADAGVGAHDRCFPWVGWESREGPRIQPAISRIAPSPPGRVVTARATPRTASWALATATGQPARARQGRSLTSLPT